MRDFEFKPFEEMTPEDYAEIGFKSGLEVHQQILTTKKLFCRCPAGQYSEETHAEILRHMRPTLSELGEYDGTALMEFKTKKDIIYRINRNTVCTYEMDDTPPFQINDEALERAVEIGMVFGATIVDEMHIARKQYLDGSIPTGFQRTAIVSVGGKIPYKGREINLIQMSIEEDSCREISDIGHRRVYNTDRLGMPLVEVVTFPEMRTPQEVAEVNELIRRATRSTGKVRTGVGAGREDVNVSVEGGTRIEIKGVPSIKRIPLLCYNEAMRQYRLLQLMEELHRRGITAESFDYKIDDITNLLKKTRYKPINDALSSGMVAKCVTLRGFKGLLNWQTQTDTYFSKEISDRVRVIACLTTLPNIINSDSQENTLATSEGQRIRKSVGATGEDSMVIVWGNEMDTAMAANEIMIRAREATMGIPSETRQALRDGTNGFERILPGPERMYPDTDLPPKKISDEWQEQIRMQMNDAYWDSEAWYHELELPEDIVHPLAMSKYSKLFKKAVNEYGIEPVFAGVALIQFPKRLGKQGFDVSRITEEAYDWIFGKMQSKKIVKESVLPLLKGLCQGRELTEEAILPLAEADEVSDQANRAREVLKSAKIKYQNKIDSYFMGLVMKDLRGRINGDEVLTIIEQNQSKG